MASPIYVRFGVPEQSGRPFAAARSSRRYSRWMPPVLETPRLILRPLEIADAVQVQLLFPRWEIVQHLANVIPWPYPADGAYTWIRNLALPAIERGEEWHWSLRLKTAPEDLIGMIGLLSPEKHKDHNRGYWIGLPWQRQGLMTEACDAVTDYWFDVLKFPVLRVPKAVANVGSRRMSEKSGMRVIRTDERDYVSGRLPSETWEITAEEWRSRREAGAAKSKLIK